MLNTITRTTKVIKENNIGRISHKITFFRVFILVKYYKFYEITI